MFLQAGVEGLLYGGLYALLGTGFYLTFGVLRRINLAYGSAIMVSVYLAAMACAYSGAPWYLGLPLALVTGVVLMSLIDRLAFTWVRADARFSMVAALGLWMAMEELVLQSPGRGRGQPILNPLDQVMIMVGPLTLRADHLLAFALSLALAGVVYWLLFKTGRGLRIRMVASDRETAALLGLDPSKVAQGAQALAAAVGVAAGYIFSAAQMAIDVHFAMWATIKGLVILVLGGVTSLPGIILAALGLGVVERLGTEAIGVGYRDLASYGLMLCLLALFPSGLGEARRAAAH